MKPGKDKSNPERNQEASHKKYFVHADSEKTSKGLHVCCIEKVVEKNVKGKYENVGVSRFAGLEEGKAHATHVLTLSLTQAYRHHSHAALCIHKAATDFVCSAEHVSISFAPVGNPSSRAWLVLR